MCHATRQSHDNSPARQVGLDVTSDEGLNRETISRAEMVIRVHTPPGLQSRDSEPFGGRAARSDDCLEKKKRRDGYL